MHNYGFIASWSPNRRPCIHACILTYHYPSMQTIYIPAYVRSMPHKGCRRWRIIPGLLHPQSCNILVLWNKPGYDETLDGNPGPPSIGRQAFKHNERGQFRKPFFSLESKGHQCGHQSFMVALKVTYRSSTSLRIACCV